MIRLAKVFLLALLATLGMTFLVAAMRVTGSPGGPEWMVPFRLTRASTVYLKAAPLLRAATSPLGRRLLAGSRWTTRAGTVTLADEGGALVARCSPCEPHIARFSAAPLRLSSLTLSLQRDGGRVSGSLAAANGGAETRLSFAGTLDDRALDLAWELPRSKLSDVLGLVRQAVPEAARATVLGHLGASGTLSLPGAEWTVTPRLEGFEVFGLGTERLRFGGVDFVCRGADGMPQRRHGGDGAPGWVAGGRMGRTLPRAVLAAEDSQFFRHPGYDFAELAPLLADPRRNGRRGASTLTQQLAKNLYTGADRSGARKLRELLYAVEMERTLGKRRILALYLNTVDWGPGVCGAADAARTYFASAPDRLNPLQAAWLGGILRNPHRAHREEFLAGKAEPKRLQWVLGQMQHRSGRYALGWEQIATPPTRLAQAEDVGGR